MEPVELQAADGDAEIERLLRLGEWGAPTAAPSDAGWLFCPPEKGTDYVLCLRPEWREDPWEPNTS